jgi:DNA-binding transcriptional MerR regulator
VKQQVAREPRIPDKVYFRIGEVSSLVGVEAHVLRFWESEFPIIKPRRAKSNQRLYRKKDVEALLLIRELLHNQGYTISGAQKILRRGMSTGKTTGEGEPETGRPVDQCLADIKKELKRIQQLLALRSLRL